ncbi:MAG TPA: alpha/beta hydrolase [Pyrinomonadaceae bacterium]|nr:alpha/beta hydrolase [Pyrinomonadaceae bacterium]
MSRKSINAMTRMRWFVFAMLVFAAMPAAVSAKDGESKFATLNGAKIHYQSYGKGNQAFVLVHGWSGNLTHWRYQIPDLAKRARVIALDLPGHGQSDKPEINYTMDHFAAAVDAVMRDAKVDKAVVLGHSMGTPIARQFYRKYPQKTLAIVIVDGGLRPFGDRATRDQYVNMFKAANYKEVGSQMFDQMTPALSAEDKKDVKASMMNTPQNVMVTAMVDMNRDDLYGNDKINVPVLALMAKSPFWPPDTEQFLRSLAPDLEYQMWEGVDHFLHLEKRKEFNDAVVAFVNKKNLLK